MMYCGCGFRKILLLYKQSNIIFIMVKIRLGEILKKFVCFIIWVYIGPRKIGVIPVVTT